MRNQNAKISLYKIELSSARRKEIPMIVYAAIVILIIIAIACVGLVCDQLGADDLRKMGIRR